jgi:hypothetical protein
MVHYEYRYTEEDAEAAVQQQDNGLGNSTTTHRNEGVAGTSTVERAHQDVERASQSYCKISLATTTSDPNGQNPVYSTSDDTGRERLGCAAQVFERSPFKTVFRRLLSGEDLPRMPLWRLYQCLPFTLRSSMKNPHRTQSKFLRHVKGTAASNTSRSRVVSFQGTLGNWKDDFRSQVSEGLVFVEDVHLCTSLKRSGSTPLARLSASPVRRRRAVRNVTTGRSSVLTRQLHMSSNPTQSAEARHAGVFAVYGLVMLYSLVVSTRPSHQPVNILCPHHNYLCAQ